MSSQCLAGQRGGMQAGAVGRWALCKEGPAHPAQQMALGMVAHLGRVKRSRGLLLNNSTGRDIACSSCGQGDSLLLGLSGSAQQGEIHPAPSPGSLSSRYLVTENSRWALQSLHRKPRFLLVVAAQKVSMWSVPEVLCNGPLSCLFPAAPGPAAAAQRTCC